MKLEVGMYVRTKKGNIYKFETNNSMAKNGAKKYMVNCSYNIIDILEVGDVIEIDVIDEDNYPIIMGINFARIDNKVELASIKDMLKNESAKLLTVITHEQMEQMKYKVEE